MNPSDEGIADAGRVIDSEAALQALLGRQEHIRLEFKSARILEKPEKQLFKDLSKEVSAFANTEGGQLVIGIEERREGPRRVAGAIERLISRDSFDAERFAQKLEGNISPYLNLRLISVRLSGAGDFIALVVVVPKGHTAYQAVDRLYYGRSEFKAEALPDHEVRVRMMRPDVCSGRVTIEWPSIPSDSLVPGRFRVFVNNSGSRTIRDLILQLRYSWSHPALLGKNASATLKKSEAFRWMPRESERDWRLLPGDLAEVPGFWNLDVRSSREVRDVGGQVQWTLYLDDAPPNSGTIALERDDDVTYP